MLRYGRSVALTVVVALSVALLAAACGPAAEATATTSSQPTATTATQPTATQPTATTAAATATRPASTAPAGATATVAETKLRPYQVLTSPAPNPSAKKGGILVYGDNDVPPDFSMWESAVATTIHDVGAAHDTLLEVNSYEKGKNTQVLPNIAYDWWTDAKGTTWTFLLTKGIKFHNGQGMTCTDVKFSLDTIKDGRDSSGDELRRSPRAAYVRRVKEFSCVDPYTLRVVTDGPLNSLIVTLSSMNFSIMPKAAWEGKLDQMITTIGPSAGAFLFDKWVPGESLQFKRNPGYWRQPYPYLDAVHFNFMGAVTAVQSAYRVGRLDDIADSDLPRAIRLDLEKQGKIIVDPLLATDSYSSWETNYRRQPWSDKRFMNAIRCAIDSKKAIDTGWNGEGFEAPVFPLKEYPGGTDYALTKEQWKAISPCHGPTAETDMTKRMQMAQDLMKQLGYGPDKLARPVLPLQQGFSNQGWASVQQDLSKIWIEPQATVVTYAQAVEKASAGEFDMYSHGYITNRMDPDQWFYEQVYSTSDRNYGKYTNPEMDALIDKMSREQDPAKRKQMVDQLSTMWLKDDVKIFIRYGATAASYTPWVKDHFFSLPTNQQNRYKFIRTWIDPEVKKQITGQ